MYEDDTHLPEIHIDVNKDICIHFILLRLLPCTIGKIKDDNGEEEKEYEKVEYWEER